MYTCGRHGRDVAVESCNRGGAEESSDRNNTSEFIFITSDHGLADGGITDMGRRRAHADRRGHFTGGIND